jgi:hypothetical protein
MAILSSLQTDCLRSFDVVYVTHCSVAIELGYSMNFVEWRSVIAMGYSIALGYSTIDLDSKEQLAVAVANSFPRISEATLIFAAHAKKAAVPD